MKSMKKLVLVGLVLLTSVMVLVGCKNDSVPEVPKYTVKFDTEHGTAPDSITVESGTKLTAEQLKALPETVDNIFEGWYDGETQAKGGEYTVTKDVTLVARWRNRDTVASVDFAPSSTTFYYGKSVTVTLSTTTDGATIHYQLGDEEWKIYNEAISITSDTTITAYATKAGLKDSTKRTATYTVRKLTKISITPPTRTVYSVGESFAGSDMVVTATYDDEKYRKVTGWTTNFGEVTREKGLKKKVTVSYTEGDNKKTATFTVDVVDPSVPTKLTSYISPNHTDDTWTYMAFGEWPQTKANVEGISLQQVVDGRGYFKDNYYMDGKGNYYVKVTANPFSESYRYSDGSSVTEGSEFYFKVEPIVWRVLTEDYKVPGEKEEPQSTGQALLLAEITLTGGILYYSVDEVNRTIEEATIYPNNYEHSQIRAFLNGLSYEYKESVSAEQTQKSEYKDAGFLQTAFTPEAQKKITPTTVDNSATSTLPNILTEEQKSTDWYNGRYYHACVNTTDKIFLLSEQEATMSDYGFAEYDVYVDDSKGTTTSTRIRVTTDYAKATGAYQEPTTGCAGGMWWLRSPHYYYSEERVLSIGQRGQARSASGKSVDDINTCVVPALSISLTGN